MSENDRSLDPITYSIREACDVSGIGKTTLYMHINEGRIKTRRIGGRVLIPAAEFRKFLLGEQA